MRATTTQIDTSHGESPIISADDRYIAYVSTLPELIGDTNYADDVILTLIT
jgi:hypothetical protein